MGEEGYSDAKRVKCRYHGPTNNEDEWQKMADKWVPTKKIDRCERIKKVADECLWLSHCSVVADVLVANKLKQTSVSKNG